MWYRRLWVPEAHSEPAYRVLSALLVPAETAYRAAVSVRAWAFDRGLLKSVAAPITTLAIGNLTVGGTGKTPISAWFAARFAALGRKPAIVMRGYGGDEVDVHRALNPDVPVHVAADRVAGVRAAQKDGSTVAILDDAFQHRAIRADANLVLVAAEDGVASPRLLPRGPWREPLAALDRANMVVVTRKAASSAAADAMAQQLSETNPCLPQAQAYLRLSGLAPYDSRTSTLGEPKPLLGFRGRLAVAGVAKPETVWAQLSEAGAVIEEYRAFPDHYRYTRGDVEQIRHDSGSGAIVATLKDAVKLSAFLGNDEVVFVPVQEVSWERGAEEVECLVAKLIGSQARD